MMAQGNLLLLRDREAIVTDWERCKDQVEELAEQMREWAAAFVEALRPAFEEFVRLLNIWYVTFQRTQVEIVLTRRWHIPYGIAHWLSQRCPRRWLPKLRPELWEWGEGEDE